MLVRIPLFASGVVLTLHVVTKLHRDYGYAGLVEATSTVCIAISGPWRGRLLDRMGLRRVVLPSVAVTAACWSVAPFTSYWPLLVLATVAGLFVIPTFSIIRQAVIAAVPDEDRRAALALDSMGVEVSFMIGPLLGVFAATLWATPWVLFGVEVCEVLAGIGLWIANPVLRNDEPERVLNADGVVIKRPLRSWVTPYFVSVCLAAAAATVVLSGTDIAVVAALRHFHDSSLIGPTLAIWGLGSLIGGLVYGAWHRPIPAYILLAGLSALTLPVAFAPSVLPLAAILFLTGVLCAPTITATVDQASRAVPESVRGEAMGWHGSAMTTGSALGAPLAGVAIDVWGYPGGFVAVGLVGLAAAGIGLLAPSGQPHAESVTSGPTVSVPPEPVDPVSSG
jgi:predicted MFS family arabinose efflux permease